MSNKAVKSRQSFFKNWSAAILASLLLGSAQSAKAAQHEFREFKANNSGLDRSTVRRMFREHMRNGNAGGGTTIGVIPPGAGASVHNARHSIDNVRLNRLDARNATFQINARGNLANLSRGVNLDLSSGERNITLGEKLLKNGPVTISFGGESKTVAAGSQVSAAEYVAVKQVLAGNGQTIEVANNGAATGGSVDLSALTSGKDVLRASDLVVPATVTANGDFSRGSDFRLLGDLNNYGTVHTYDSDARGRAGAVRADNILNATGAHITSEVDLTLQANGNITNQGDISSKGGLTLIAGSSISNTGRIESLNGNVTLDGAHDADLTIKNAGGTVVAQNGSINVRHSGYNGSSNTYVTGGDFLSRTLGLNAGDGTIEANVGNVTGNVESEGYAVHFGANSDKLSIGNTSLVDPTFKNVGNILINGNLDVAADLTIIAGGNITGTNGFRISTNNGGASASGFPLNIIAGANITSAGTDSGPLPGTQTAVDTTFNGGTATGGLINLTGMTINTNATSGNNNAGNILMAAFAGSGIGSGAVTAGNINADGFGTGNNGNVKIFGGGAITVGSIDSDSGSGGTGVGDILLASAQPTSSGAVTYLANGQLQGGSPTLNPSNTLNNGTITVTGVVSGGILDLKTNGTYSILGAAQLKATDLSITTGTNITNNQISADVFSTDKLTLVGLNGADFGNFQLFPVVINDKFVINGGFSQLTVSAGIANLDNQGNQDVTILGATTTNSFRIETEGKLTVAGDITVTADGVISLAGAQNGLADLIINPGVSITANGTVDNFGNVFIQNAVGIDKKQYKALAKQGSAPEIVFGAGSSIITVNSFSGGTNAGTFRINIGASTGKSPKSLKKSPSQNINLTYEGTGFLATQKGKKPFITFDEPSPINNWTIKNTFMIINNNLSKDALTFAGDVTIDLDPPAAPTVLATETSNRKPHPILLAGQPIAALNTLPVATLPAGVANIDTTAVLANQFSNLITTEDIVTENTSVTVDDSYMMTDAPMQTDKNVAVCSDMDFVVGLKPASATSTSSAGLTQVSHQANMTLDNGCVLYAPASDTTVTTPLGTVSLAKGSLAVVVVDGHHLSVYDVHDHHKGSISLTIAGNTVALSPGRHLTVTDSSVQGFSDVNPIESVMHKAMRNIELNNHRVFVSDFSIPSAVGTIGALNAIMNSDHVDARKLADRVLKTSAVVMQLDGGNSEYRYHTKPRAVALNSLK
ncbi:MAG: hypothetical protein K2X93_12735 [Candidatus Obscuribacterales bacterium]|nr:hypothetical protein [Candidatus Obscuribacterales bacterium]